jgi:hypothetical protein
MAGMVYDLSVKKGGDILHVRVTGERTRAAIMAVSKEIMEACLREGTSKLLIDVREFHGQLALIDDYEVPAKEFPTLPPHGGLLKASAVVDVPENADRFVFFEDVAQSRGFNFRVFPDIDRAMKWLGEQANRA